MAWNPLFCRVNTRNHIWFFKEGTNLILNHRIAVTISLSCSIFFLNLYANSIPSNEDIARKLLVESALEQVYLHAAEFGMLVFPNMRTAAENSVLSMWMQQS